MLNEETIKLLTGNISEIIKTTTLNGFTNLRLFQPLIASESLSLHFLVKIEKGDVSLFDKARLKLNLVKILNYDDIIILTENELNSEAKAKIIGPQLTICPANISAIQLFFAEKLQPSTNSANQLILKS